MPQSWVHAHGDPGFELPGRPLALRAGRTWPPKGRGRPGPSQVALVNYPGIIASSSTKLSGANSRRRAARRCL